MRARLAAFPGRAVALVGAFHAAALVADPDLDPLPRDDTLPPAAPPPPTALVAYRSDLLDARSGYPAGVLAPRWHAEVHAALVDGTPLPAVVARVVVEVCRAMRAERQVAGSPDAAEALRIALELARLRGRAAPGRAEVLEALETTLARGEAPRALARALETVMVGRARGHLHPDTPRSGLLPAVESLVAGLRLPGPDDPEKTLRLDPLRSDLDRRRHVALHRLGALQVPYAESVDREEGTLTHAWRVGWSPATEAALELAGAFGVDLAQAAAGALAHARPRERGDDAPSAGAEILWLKTVAECGLADLARQGLAGLPGLAERARLPELVEAVGLVDRVRHGHVPGLLPEATPEGVPGALPAFPGPDLGAARETLYRAGVAALDGLAGSTDPADARALASLVRLALDEGRADDGRLGAALDHLDHAGAARIAGAAAVARLRLGRLSPATLGADLAARVVAATTEPARRDLGDRLQGVVDALGARLDADPTLFEPLAAPVETLPDADFVARLPALRHGFDPLSPAARERLLQGRAERWGGEPFADADPTLAALDLAGRAAVEALGLMVDLPLPPGAPRPARPLPGHALGPLVRWRLVLGREVPEGPAARLATALDALYGPGRGEGEGAAAGRGRSFPTAREWSGEVEALFGAEVREEVVGRAAERGDPHALLLLDPETVTPSVTLLEQALALKGGLAEDQLAPLRRLCERVTRALVDALAVRVRPALAGLSSPRPTRRRTDRLHLPRTVAANLHTARPGPDGPRLHPERLRFRARARRELDWQVVLVVDTSGSMEASVVHAAMMAAILAALPAVTVSFYGFADEVVDFSDRVADPLGLLLSVSIGGGTRIHRALRYARERLRVPARTVLVLVTDFEEGGSPAALAAEARALVESGIHALGVAALDDDAKPRYSARVVAAGRGSTRPRSTGRASAGSSGPCGWTGRCAASGGTGSCWPRPTARCWWCRASITRACPGAPSCGSSPARRGSRCGSTGGRSPVDRAPWWGCSSPPPVFGRPPRSATGSTSGWTGWGPARCR